MESFLGEPVSIDFDASDRLYIADNAFGSIRVVNPDGMINTLTEKDNPVYDIAQMRINKQELTRIGLNGYNYGRKIFSRESNLNSLAEII